MASLKEVKHRIQSVKTTRKITQARQMISSAKLHRMQSILANANAYRQGIEGILSSITSSEYQPSSALCTEPLSGAVAVVIISSNSGMCGSFNSRLEKQVDELCAQYAEEKLQFYPIGKMMREILSKKGCTICGDFDPLADKASYNEAAELVTKFIQLFASGQLKRLEVVYYNFRTVATQNVSIKRILPYAPISGSEYNDGYILEPSQAELVNELIPKLICAEFYTMLMSNQASEHASRTIAMQLATENADEILDHLQLTYNKLRQQNITSELLDIVGASFG